MNMTSTIAWGLIWSVYPVGFKFFGNGLMYAFGTLCLLTLQEVNH